MNGMMSAGWFHYLITGRMTSAGGFLLLFTGRMHLQEAFKQDDLQVKVTYTVTDKEHNCDFIRYKPIIHIIKIKKL